MRLQNRSYSRINLIDLLSKRKKTLDVFLNEVGITTYELLKNRCSTMGVHPPTEEQFNQALGNPVLPAVSSPTEGVVVLVPTEEHNNKAVITSTENDVSVLNTNEKNFSKRKKKHDDTL